MRRFPPHSDAQFPVLEQLLPRDLSLRTSQAKAPLGKGMNCHLQRPEGLRGARKTGVLKNDQKDRLEWTVSKIGSRTSIIFDLPLTHGFYYSDPYFWEKKLPWDEKLYLRSEQ